MLPCAKGGDAPRPGLHGAPERCAGVHGQAAPRAGVPGRAASRGRALAGGSVQAAARRRRAGVRPRARQAAALGARGEGTVGLGAQWLFGPAVYMGFRLKALPGASAVAPDKEFLFIFSASIKGSRQRLLCRAP